MRKQVIGFLTILSVTCVAAHVAHADIKITTRTTSGGQTMESTTYIKGARQRNELIADMVNLLQCDRGQSVQLNTRAKTYLATKLSGDGAVSTSAAKTPPPDAPITPPAEVKKGGVVTYTNTIVDTGERKQMFGFTARHLKVSMVSESSPDACNQETMRMESDGWYIDLQYGVECPVEPPQTAALSAGTREECRDEIRYKKVGAGKLGYPALVTTTIYMKDGQKMSTTQEIAALNMTSLDAALFEVPADYKEAKNYTELMGMSSAMTMSDSPGVIDASGADNRAPSAAPAKDPNSVRIGIAVVNNRTERSFSESALRDRLINFLDDQGVDAVSLGGGGTADIAGEAKSKQCDFILFTDVVNLKQSGGGKLGGFLGRATGVSGIGGAIGKHEARLDFKLLAVDGLKQVLQSSANAKDDGGEDGTLNAALESEARAVAAEVKKSK